MHASFTPEFSVKHELNTFSWNVHIILTTADFLLWYLIKPRWVLGQWDAFTKSESKTILCCGWHSTIKQVFTIPCSTLKIYMYIYYLATIDNIWMWISYICMIRSCVSLAWHKALGLNIKRTGSQHSLMMKWYFSFNKIQLAFHSNSLLLSFTMLYTFHI